MLTYYFVWQGKYGWMFNMKAKLHTFLLGILGIFLCACAGSPSPDRFLANKQTYMLSLGNPPAYVEGYIDGCACGRLQAGDRRFSYRKNSLRFDKDALYAKGWQDGEINCRNEVLLEQVEAEQNKNSSFMPQSIDAERQRRVEAASQSQDAEMKEIWEKLKK